jgi:hypothetical protein
MTILRRGLLVLLALVALGGSSHADPAARWKFLPRMYSPTPAGTSHQRARARVVPHRAEAFCEIASSVKWEVAKHEAAV